MNERLKNETKQSRQKREKSCDSANYKLLKTEGIPQWSVICCKVQFPPSAMIFNV